VSAAYWKILVEQGSTWRTALTLYNGTTSDPQLDLTGYTARMQARAAVDSPTALLDIGTDTGEIVIDGAAGRLTIVIPGDTSTPWTWRYGVYDLKLFDPDGEPIRLIEGEIELSRGVTR
jgi:hypothetical protein